MRVTVFGAGVLGLTCAVALAERGFSVVLGERSEPLGSGAASWLAGGMLAPFCEGETAEEPVVRLGQQAANWWEKRVPGVARRGTLVVAPARDAAELRRLAGQTEHHRWLDEAALAALEPDLAGRFRRGLFFAEEAHLDPRQAMAALADRLRNLGGTIVFGADHLDVSPHGLIVDCRGFAARDALPDLRPVKGEMLLLRTGDITLSRPVRLAHPRTPAYVVPRGGGLFMIGATMVEAGDRRVTARGVASLLNAAYALHPAFAEAELVETGADLRPAFPDNMPRLRRRGCTLFVNGVYRHGFLLAPALAEMVAEAVADPDSRPELMDEDHRERRTA
ncbi:glycine oxidase ThiO [Aurantimonas sp. VKM B-3413]|uniref:glycine oxidase ThiO n=1 Tax=Aurantimonas sp. VKM B-3413 TaxID=2779401 RepID=UPI001E3E66FD|nr:glycine oxidase ThiO [Aurantimonas sp. VKM B-3413]MCB8839523.1 glycine oxidase ThiO [Aurantimonas sp. VKM B-3413]